MVALTTITTITVAATTLIPLLIDSVAMAKAIMNFVSAGDDFTEEDLQNIEAKRARLVQGAASSSAQWTEDLAALTQWRLDRKAELQAASDAAPA